MTAAPTYNRLFNFTNFQALAPATPLPAIQLDSELSSIKVTLDALIANAALIQRSDGVLANQSVGPQQLQPSLLTGISPPTQWSGSGVSYQVGMTVFSGLLFYVCNTANVSSTGNPPASFAAWTFLADFSGVTIPAGSITSAAFAPGAVNSAALGPNLALSSSPSTGDNSTAIATTAFVDAQAASMLVGCKSRIINGAMGIDQRNGGSTGTAPGYIADRFKYGATQASKATYQRQASSSVVGFPFFINIGSSGVYSLLTTDHFDISYTVEAIDCYDLAFGTANAQALTLSFWVQANATGTFGGSLRNSGATRSYPFTYAISAANTWQKISITIPGDTGGVWLNASTGVGLIIAWGLGAGATFSGTAGAWASGNFTTATGSTQVVGVSLGNFGLTGVQLGVGAGAATAPFEFRLVQQELALCQRYYETQTNDLYQGNVTSGATYPKYTPFAVTKRATPTMTYSGITAGGFATSVSLSTPGSSGIKWGATANATAASQFVQLTWAADADF